jgi:hypothetical protein
MPHPSHKLKAYTADVHNPLVFCSLCGKDEKEGLDYQCAETFYHKVVDNGPLKFQSGLPFND